MPSAVSTSVHRLPSWTSAPQLLVSLVLQPHQDHLAACEADLDASHLATVARHDQ